MARVIADHRIKYNGRVFAPGETLTGVPQEMIETLTKLGAVKTLPNLEPSLKEGIEAWRKFIVDSELATAEEAAKMKKADLVALWTGDEEEEEEVPETKPKGK